MAAIATTAIITAIIIFLDLRLGSAVAASLVVLEIMLGEAALSCAGVICSNELGIDAGLLLSRIARPFFPEIELFAIRKEVIMLTANSLLVVA